MKLAIAVILALVCHMTFADPAVKKVCDSTKQYFNGNACVDCKAPCKECVFKNGKESCINCGVDTGLFLEIKDDIGQCGNCTGNCTACRGSKASDCATPATTFKVSPSAVVKCEKAGCLWCKEENKCGKCEVGFRLENDTCTACQSPSCVDCSDSVSTCKKCAYFTKLNNNTCEPCAAGCTGCPCTACNPGYAFANNSCTRCNDLSCVACAGNTSVCTACMKGTFLVNETCKSCDANCKECTGTDKCSKCSSKFALKEGKCVACPTDCDECNPNGECTKCKKNFYASSDKKTCTACPAGCDECGAEGVCTKCLAGYLPKTDKKGCEACTTSGNCQECTNTTSCKTCQDGYNPDGKGQCKSIMSCSRGQALDGTGTCFDGTVDNCAYGNNITQSCYYCAEGYYAKDKTCTPCPNGCKSCSASSKGYVYCFTLAQTGFSSKTESNGKGDKTGYLGQNLVYTIKSNGDDDTCMPNTWAATYTKEFTKHKCLDYDKCPILRKSGAWECYIEGNAVKMTLSLFAIVVASLFTL